MWKWKENGEHVEEMIDGGASSVPAEGPAWFSIVCWSSSW
jgi:hypothetical protein